MKKVRKRLFAFLLTVLLIIPPLVFPVNALTFTDVASTHYAYDEISYMTDRGFMSGTGNYFYPSNAFTRGDTVVTLAKMFGVDITNNNVSTGFTDVPSGSTYAAAVKWAKGHGVVSGESATTFNPGGALNRQTVCVIVCAFFDAFDYELTYVRNAKTFSDHDDISSWAVDSVVKLYRAGLIDGTSSTAFSPKATMSRAQAAVLLYNVYLDYVFAKYYTPGLSNNVWTFKVGEIAMAVSNANQYHGRNADLQVFNFMEANYTNINPKIKQNCTWDCRNAMKYRILYEADADAYSIRPICSFNGYCRMLDVVNNNAPFAAGQKIQQYYPLTGQKIYCQRFIFKKLGGDNYTIHLASNRNLVFEYVEQNENSGISELQLAEYESGNVNQIFTISEATSHNGNGYYNYNDLEDYYMGLGWQWPLKYDKTLSSSYGYRYLSYNPDDFHQGIDVPSYYQSLYPVNAGKIVEVGSSTAMGEYIVLELNDTIYQSTTKIRVVYQHLSENSPYVSGLTITPQDIQNYKDGNGVVIGIVGNTGISGGPHLHMTVISTNGTNIGSLIYINNTLNPLMFYARNDLSFQQN